MRKIFMSIILVSTIMGHGFAQEFKNIELPAPKKTGGMPLMDVLNARQTGRVFSDKPLELQQISDLLWAAWGINRPESGKRTAPSARNFQETTLYVMLPAGVYKWDAKENKLLTVVAGDYRGKVGMQPFVATAPLIILFVTDYERYKDMTPEQCEFYAGVDAGYISQNIYLYCASVKLSTVVLGSVKKADMTKLLNLPEKQKVVLGQPVGWPGEE